MSNVDHGRGESHSAFLASRRGQTWNEAQTKPAHKGEEKHKPGKTGQGNSGALLVHVPETPPPQT